MTKFFLGEANSSLSLSCIYFTLNSNKHAATSQFVLITVNICERERERGVLEKYPLQGSKLLDYMDFKKA